MALSYNLQNRLHLQARTRDSPSFTGWHYLTHLLNHLHLQARTRDSPSFTGRSHLTNLPNRLHLQARTRDSPFLYWTQSSHQSAESTASTSEDARLSFPLLDRVISQICRIACICKRGRETLLSFTGWSHLTNLPNRLYLQAKTRDSPFLYWTASSHTSAKLPAYASEETCLVITDSAGLTGNTRQRMPSGPGAVTAALSRAGYGPLLPPCHAGQTRCSQHHCTACCQQHCAAVVGHHWATLG